VRPCVSTFRGSFYLASWRIWRFLAQFMPARRTRAGFLSIFGPLSLFAMLAIWAFGLIAGFGLLHFSLGTQLHSAAGPEHDFLDLRLLQRNDIS